MDAGALEQSRDPEVGTDVFLVGRRIHHYAGFAPGEIGTEITPETRVCGSHVDTQHGVAEIFEDPAGERLETDVGNGHKSGDPCWGPPV